MKFYQKLLKLLILMHLRCFFVSKKVAIYLLLLCKTLRLRQSAQKTHHSKSFFLWFWFWKGFWCGINFRLCHICLEEKYFIMWSDIWQNVYWETSHTSSKCALIMGGMKKWHLWSVWTNVEHCPPYEGFILHINCTYQPYWSSLRVV